MQPPSVLTPQRPWCPSFTGDLGEDRTKWTAYDATDPVKQRPFTGMIVIDQGTADEFLERELRPELFREAYAQSGQALDLRIREGYDHSDYFISTLIEDHLRHHAKALVG